MNVAMISSWHVHARGYAEEFNQVPGCKVTAVWDECEETAKKWAEELGCIYYKNYDELLTDSSIDAVAITTRTVDHTDVMIKAANAGKHIFTEKVLAVTTEDALKIRDAVVKNNVKFVISYPHRCRADLNLAYNMLKNGEIGRCTYARLRNAHDGSSAGWLPEHFYDEAQCGGGAMIDLGAHTIYLLEWLLGEPKAVQSTFTKVYGHAVEDNAVSVMEFTDGAIGVAETAFVSSGCPLTLELCGTKGSLMVRDGLTYANESTGGKWVTAEQYPEAKKTPIEQFAEAVMEGKESDLSIVDAVCLTRGMEAAYRSYRSGKKEELY